LKLKWLIVSALVMSCTQLGSTRNEQTKLYEQTLAQTRDAAAQLVGKLGAKLKQAIATNGTASAVETCKLAAPQIAEEVSQQQGWQVGRVGTRVRNPNNQPNSWQQAALAEFAARVKKGEKLDGMETYSVQHTKNGKTLRYAKAIGVQPMCIVCHGKTEQIPTEVQIKLRTLYPNDQATGYSVGELRGAVVIERPLI